MSWLMIPEIKISPWLAQKEYITLAMNQEPPKLPMAQHVHDLDYIAWNVRSLGCRFLDYTARNVRTLGVDFMLCHRV